MKSTILNTLIIGLTLIFSSSTSLFSQQLKPGSLFQEHMVLQRDKPIKVWGEAAPQTTIVVTLNNHSVSTKANDAGAWNTTLPKQKAGGPYVFKIQSPTQSLQFNDVMIGEVWICSGQSNMFMGYEQIPEIKALDSLAQSIRCFKVENTVAFTEQKYLAGTWQKKNPPSAVAFAFAYHLQKNIEMPVGIILSSWGSSSIEGWMPRDMTQKLPYFKSIMENFDADSDKIARIDTILAGTGKRVRKDDIFLRTQPNIIYNAMMKPIAPYTCRGMVWYQGEANGKTIESMLQYGTTLPLWIKRIRQEWSDDHLNFIGVMLPGFGNKLHKKTNSEDILENPNVESWAWIRESQCKALELPHTAIVTTIDLGEKNNIHPKDKLPVGQRIALFAQKQSLNEAITAEGPVLKNISLHKSSLVLHYINAKGLKTTNGEPPKAFWLADDSEKWYPATAKIKGSKVFLSCPKLDKPLYVRYAFAAMPAVNLVNNANLPARPFRTDHFIFTEPVK
jgi:sialate O-acetylesterase